MSTSRTGIACPSFSCTDVFHRCSRPSRSSAPRPSCDRHARSTVVILEFPRFSTQTVNRSTSGSKYRSIARSPLPQHHFLRVPKSCNQQFIMRVGTCLNFERKAPSGDGAAVIREVTLARNPCAESVLCEFGCLQRQGAVAHAAIDRAVHGREFAKFWNRQLRGTHQRLNAQGEQVDIAEIPSPALRPMRPKALDPPLSAA